MRGPRMRGRSDGAAVFDVGVDFEDAGCGAGELTGANGIGDNGMNSSAIGFSYVITRDPK